MNAKNFVIASILIASILPLVASATTIVKPTVADYDYASRDYAYFFGGGAEGADNDWHVASNWEPSTVPQAKSVGPYATMLLDGSMMTGVAADANGIKYVAATNELEGWTFKLGLYDHVSLTLSSLNKFQGGGWIYVDSTSKLNIGGFGNGSMGNDMTLHVAAEEGVTFISSVNFGDLAMAYCFDGEGSVAYKGAVLGGSHTLKGVVLALSPDVADGATCVRSRTLVGYHESSSFSFNVSSATIVITNALGAAVEASVKAKGEDLAAIGDVWFLQDRDALKVYYVDYGTEGVAVPRTDRMTAVQTQGSYYRNDSFFQPLIGLRIDSTKGGQSLKYIKARVGDATEIGAITDVHLFTTSVPYFAPGLAKDYWENVSKSVPHGSSREISVSYSGGTGPQISAGMYLWLAVLLNPNSSSRGEIDAEITEVSLGDATSTTLPQILNAAPEGAGRIYPYDWHVTPFWRMNGWTMSTLTSRHFSCYTDMIAFYCVVNTDGTIGHGWNGEQFTDEKMSAAIARMKELRGSRDVPILVSIAWCKDALHSVTADPVLRSRMAENLAAFVERFELDGVDFDWEYPTTKADWENWCLAVAELKPRLFALGGGKQVSVSVTGYKMNEAANTLGAGNALKGLLQQCDFVCTMSYDSNSIDGHAPQWLMGLDVERCQDLGGIPNCKIAAGQAFYTNFYPDAPNTQYGFNWVVNNYPQYVDSTDIFTDNDGKTVTYNSLATIRSKTAWCRTNGVGVMIWANETDVALTHEKSATRAMFSQIGPMERGSTVTVSSPEDWACAASTDGSIELIDDITLGVDDLMPRTISGTVNGNGHTITLDGGVAIAANGLTIKAATPDAAVEPPAPTFAAGGKVATTGFARDENGKWTFTTFAELANDAIGADVEDDQIKVYAADSVDGLKTAEAMADGVRVKEKKSAVMTTIEFIPPNPSATKQFFKATFGE